MKKTLFDTGVDVDRKEISIKSMKITNFKGIGSLSINFSDETNIFGKNGTGKTTIFDAFTWLMFGKDSQDNKQFNIKPLNPDNSPVHKVDNEVKAVIDVNGREISIKRVHKEKWVKRRGSTEAEFSGHETSYFWNDVPMALKDFQAKIDNIIDEELFKLLTNTSYFNGLHWTKRRETLIDMAGTITDDDVMSRIDKSVDTSGLEKALNEFKSIDEFKREIANKKKRVKKEMDEIPSRVDEIGRSLPEDRDWEKLEKEIESKRQEVESIDNQLQDKSKATEEQYKKIRSHQADIHELERRIDQVKRDERLRHQKQIQNAEDVLSAIKRSISIAESEIRDTKKDVETQESIISSKTDAIDKQRKRWDEVEARRFNIDTDELVCPTCKREFEEEDKTEKIEDMRKNFNHKKAEALKEIEEDGKKLSQEIERHRKKIQECKSHIASQNKELDRLNTDLQKAEHALEEAQDNNGFSDEANAKIDELESELHELKANAPTDEVDDSANEELKARKHQIQREIDSLKNELSAREQREKMLSRKGELLEEESKLSKELTRLESSEFAITGFMKAKMELLKERINSRFKMVQFKLFDTQINGGEIEACETLINGVPFSDANNASQINAGIDILNVIGRHYNVTAPIFIDNRESVTDIIDTESQIINLIVSEDKKLRVAS